MPRRSQHAASYSLREKVVGFQRFVYQNWKAIQVAGEGSGIRELDCLISDNHDGNVLNKGNAESTGVAAIFWFNSKKPPLLKPASVSAQLNRIP